VDAGQATLGAPHAALLHAHRAPRTHPHAGLAIGPLGVQEVAAGTGSAEVHGHRAGRARVPASRADIDLGIHSLHCPLGALRNTQPLRQHRPSFASPAARLTLALRTLGHARNALPSFLAEPQVAVTLALPHREDQGWTAGLAAVDGAIGAAGRTRLTGGSGQVVVVAINAEAGPVVEAGAGLAELAVGGVEAGGAELGAVLAETEVTGDGQEGAFGAEAGAVGLGCGQGGAGEADGEARADLAASRAGDAEAEVVEETVLANAAVEGGVEDSVDARHALSADLEPRDGFKTVEAEGVRWAAADQAQHSGLQVSDQTEALCAH
jgi:hypothetical protein